MPKFKHAHNRKRNPAIIYNILVNEFIDGSLRKSDTADSAYKLIKEYFSKDSTLMSELSLYNSLLEAYSNRKFDSKELVEKLVGAVKDEYRKFDIVKLNETKSKLIGSMNRAFGKEVWSKYNIKNYKNVATIYQILNEEIRVSDRVLLESRYIDDVVSNIDVSSVVVVEDVNLVYGLAHKGFKEEYSGNLIEENYRLLDLYMKSDRNNGVEYKLYINDEIGRIKTALKEYLISEDVAEDVEIKTLIRESLTRIESFKNTDDDESILEAVMNGQRLVKEIK